MSGRRKNGGRKAKDWLRRLHYSDNLPVLREMEDNSVDLIYLDPPFNSNRAYNIIYGNDLGQVTAFEDTWYWSPQCDEYLKELQNGDRTSVQTYGVLESLISAFGQVQVCAYLVNMGVRLVEMRRVLKDTGSIYLHCDPTASHYLKILMDCIFGKKNFRNEIIWHYRTGGIGKKHFAKKHDVILFYSKTENYHFELPKEKSRDPNRFNQIDPEGRAYYEKAGNLYYLDEGTAMTDTWIDIHPVRNVSKERLGYPTQKPIALLDRIIQASSNEGGIVFDPFCGCGTSIAAAEKHKRQWIGIDITYSAIAAINERFDRQRLKIWGDIEILGSPKTINEVDKKLLDKESPLYARKEFEKFCVTTIKGLPNDKMGADGGIDGVIQLKGRKQAIISVKSGGVSVKDVRELKGILGEKRAIGIFITRNNPTKDMTEFANKAGIYEGEDDLLDRDRSRKIPILQIFTLGDILEGKRPMLPQ